MKMSKNMVRVISIVLVVFMLAMAVTPVLAAAEVKIPDGQTSTLNTEDTKNLTSFADTVINILKIVGAAVAVIVLLIMGIKYLMASVEEKADFKKAMIPYVVGAFLVFAAPWIAEFIIDLVSGFGTTTGA